MEERKITVVSTRNQKKSVIMSAATTLAELKADLRQNDIDYDGMAFYEGVSKIELKDDNSVLPHDVPYKGTTTNELVFMLTNTNKKIRSGMDLNRMEIYVIIKDMGLQNKCIEKFGKNFTTCKNEELLALINENKIEPENAIKVEINTSATEVPNTLVESVDTKARIAIFKILDILEDNDIYDYLRMKKIKDMLNSGMPVEEERTCAVKSSYSEDEIDEMFEFVQE